MHTRVSECSMDCVSQLASVTVSAQLTTLVVATVMHKLALMGPVGKSDSVHLVSCIGRARALPPGYVEVS